LDKTLAWTADYLIQWYGVPSVELDAYEQSIAASLLWALRGNAVQRALVAWSCGWAPAQQASGTDWLAPFLAELLDDPYDAVRYIAHRSLRTLPEFKTLEFDFMSAAADRTAAKQDVLQAWRALNRTDDRDDAAEILMNSDGTLQQTTMDRLLRDRDIRPINLAE
jgi:hypothetical protein